MNRQEAGFCGDYCGKCPNYPGECVGCIASGHRDCRFVSCCLDKGIGHCGFCADFPCEDLTRFVPDDSADCEPGYHVEALRRRKEIGTEAWLGEQRQKWRNR
jgi:hypothetical protein